jgi:hypothetical protein
MSAAEAWWAEVIAKAALIGGSADGAELIASSGVSGLLRHADGGVVRVGDVASFELVDRHPVDCGPVDLGPVEAPAVDPSAPSASSVRS